MTNPPEQPSHSLPEGREPDPEFMKEFEKVINSFAQATEAGRVEEAEGAAMQALLLACQEALQHPTPSLKLKEEAGDRESERDWPGAERAYRKVLDFEEKSGNFAAIAKAQMDLSRLLRHTGKLTEARQLARAATESARRTEMFPVVVMALESEANCALAAGDAAAALSAASAAVQLIQPGRLYDSMRARSLVLRARCTLANGELAGAETDLEASWALLQSRTLSQRLPGAILGLAQWWDLKSAVLERQAKFQEARQAMTQAIEFWRQMQSSYAVFALLEALEKLGALSKQIGDFPGGESALAEAKVVRSGLRLPIG
jgi:tetratricopeptide (TPR) repeat protein